MGIASSSAAQLGDAAPTGLMPAKAGAALTSVSNSESSAYGNLELMGAPKRKKKPVLVLDPDELAKAHLLFQQDAADQMEDFDWDKRKQANSGLVPMGSEDLPEEPEAQDIEEFAEEADPPAPEQVLALTGTQDVGDDEDVDEDKISSLDAVRARREKKMALNPPTAEEKAEMMAIMQGETPPEATQAPPPPASPPATPDIPADAAPTTAPEEISTPEAEPPLVAPVEEAPSNNEVEEIASAPEPSAPAEPPASVPPAPEIPVAKHNFEAEQVPTPIVEASAATNEDSSTDYVDEPVDGYAFMRNGEAPRINTASMQSSQNALRAKLMKAEEEEQAAAADSEPGFFARLWQRLFG